jgi:hypothetical protein
LCSNLDNNKNEELLIKTFSDSSLEIKNNQARNENFENILEKLKWGVEIKTHSNLHFKNQNYLLAREGYLKVLI